MNYRQIVKNVPLFAGLSEPDLVGHAIRFQRLRPTIQNALLTVL